MDAWLPVGERLGAPVIIGIWLHTGGYGIRPYGLHSSLFTLHSSLFTLHSSLCILHSALHSAQTGRRGRRPLRIFSTLCTLHSALCILHCTLHSAQTGRRGAVPFFRLPLEGKLPRSGWWGVTILDYAVWYGYHAVPLRVIEWWYR